MAARIGREVGAAAVLTLRESTRIQLHRQLLDAAQSITVESGWASVTMAKIGHRVGVSRQTVYNEFGNKPDLAAELVNRELDRFLDVVRVHLVAHRNVVDGLIAACDGALAMARASPLLKAALDLADPSTNDLLPLLTTQSQGLIDAAVLSLERAINAQHPEIDVLPHELHLAADAIVRIVLSHITRPGACPTDASTQVGWIALQTLGRR